MTILITGSAGFIGSNFLIDWHSSHDEVTVSLDKISYAANLDNHRSLINIQNHVFIKGDINDTKLVGDLLRKYQPRAIIHFAAESHVDHSIENPEVFIENNFIGTFHLLECAKSYWVSLPKQKSQAFRFLHISTDEVYGSLEKDEPPFLETNRYSPNSPYSASKAASDHIVRAYHKTYGLPVLTTHCSNNFGPYQFPEKLIPRIIHNALAHKILPVFGDGLHIRDWLFVSDHCSAICAVLDNGKIGEVYNIGGFNEKTNIEIVKFLCNALDEVHPVIGSKKIKSYHELITYVKDRPGHDYRYAINSNKIQTELNWRPIETFETGIRKTVQWYLDNPDWFDRASCNKHCQQTQL